MTFHRLYLSSKNSQPTAPDFEVLPEPEIEERLDQNDQAALQEVSETPVQNGAIKPFGEPYTKMIVIARMKDEDVEWVHENFGGEPYINASIYTADDVTAALHPPKNKGHEVMIYLSYIIDSYDDLADVNIFLHSHRYAWHNDELLDYDAAAMISRLSAERVQREGYMNMRCMSLFSLSVSGERIDGWAPKLTSTTGHWEPGCPAWMHPGTIEEDINKQEETLLAGVWSELFPLDPIPSVLAQPCCAQFAISRDRIRSLPLSRYIFYRDWLLETDLSDYLSGRVWEYIWQFVFTGENVLCVNEHACYCDGFGVCFGSDEEYAAYWSKNSERVRAEEELRKWEEDSARLQLLREEGTSDEVGEIDEPEVGRDLELEGRIKGIQAWCEQRREVAKKYGAMNRAVEREWRDGGGS